MTDHILQFMPLPGIETQNIFEHMLSFTTKKEIVKNIELGFRRKDRSNVQESTMCQTLVIKSSKHLLCTKYYSSALKY